MREKVTRWKKAYMYNIHEPSSARSSNNSSTSFYKTELSSLVSTLDVTTFSSTFIRVYPEASRFWNTTRKLKRRDKFSEFQIRDK